MKSCFQPSLRIILWSVVGVLLISITLLLANKEEDPHGAAPDKKTSSLSFTIDSPDPPPLSMFDGLPLEAPEDLPVMVMIDNFISARPQHSGITKASLVYEALAEGGITRLMLVFPSQSISRVGPIRSARQYFVSFAEEIGGVYVHAGGAPDALQKLLNSTRLLHLDEDDRLEGDLYNFRDLRYSAPHNLFGDLSLMRRRAQERSFTSAPPLASRCFSDPAENSGEDLHDFRIVFSPDPLAYSSVEYKYDGLNDHYRRYFVHGRDLLPHTDQSSSQQVAPKNILLQFAKSHLIPGDEKERIELEIIGSGKALLLSGGKKMEAQWKKERQDSPTQYFDGQGLPLCFSPGQTWISIVDDPSFFQETLR